VVRAPDAMQAEIEAHEQSDAYESIEIRHVKLD